MEYTSTQIQAMVRNMDHSKRRWASLKSDLPKYREKLEKENKVLYEVFPSLWEMHIEDKLDEKFFKMLVFKRRIERGEITVEQASAAIGQVLFQEYVKPVVDATSPTPPPPMSYEEYYKQFS
jgi:hypothetical protein